MIVSGASRVAQLADVDHAVGLAVVSDPERAGFAVAAVRAASGDVLAADGWFYDQNLPDTPALTALDWDDWDDLPSKLLWRSNMPWFDSLLVYLLPHYSLARGVAELLLHWGHEQGRPPIEDTHLVAYFPVPDHEAILGHLRAAQRKEDERASDGNSWAKSEHRGSRASNAILGLELLA